MTSDSITALARETVEAVYRAESRRVFATLVALRTGASASAELDDEALAALAAECLETGETIRNRDWEHVLPVVCDHCPHCDFLPHCTQYWRDNGDTDL